MIRSDAFTRGLVAVLCIVFATSIGNVARAESGTEEAAPAGAPDENVCEPLTESGADEAASGDSAEPSSSARSEKSTVDRASSGDDAKKTWLAHSANLVPTSSGSKAATTSQAIPLPKAEGSITGMGESFSPELSSGAATYTVPLQVMPGRAGVQPTLSLSYSSTAGNGIVGEGWSLGVPFIARQSDRGMPRYRDAAAWTPEEDRFFYNGGQELVPVDASAIATAECGAPTCAPIPAELSGWQQYRARVEGGFMRFFRSPDATRWVVQGPDGMRLDFGALPGGDGPPEAVAASKAALQSEFAGGQGRVYRWWITRAADAHGSTIYYQHLEDHGQRYLADIFYTSPHGSCGSLTSADARTHCQAPLAQYGRRIHLVYEPRVDSLASFASSWSIWTGLRLHRIEMTSAEGAPGRRTLVRRYHLGYDESSYWSLLSTVQMEGRPQHLDPITMAMVGDAGVDESSLDDSVIGALLPALDLHYSKQPNSPSSALGMGGVDATVHHASASPPYSVGADADLFDVNSDGLPDLVVTDPARFHTRAGAPAVGVYFNGFDGATTTPAAPGTFSAPVPTAVGSELSQVLRLSNLNISPMDVDGDGRADYLHLPRQRNTGYFTPVRSGATDAVTPAQQGWGWAYLPRQLPSFDADPRIDFAHDAARLREFDVNNDHLVDIVRTTGTSIQVWLNLGWLPEGDGRYGSYTYDTGTRAFVLSTAPIETCLPSAGTPLDFGDPEVRLGDMNGDGITDIVRTRVGRVIYWPGRGEGAFGTGPASCTPGIVSGRYVEMTQAPNQINPNLDGVYLADLNADGVDDLVQVRFSDVDVWFNYGGDHFSSRVRLTGTPYAPAFDTRVRLADVDGSGTLDILYANGNDWEWVDPMGGQRPRLLSSVENGLGAQTDLTYDTSVEDYLRDLAEADACIGDSCERFLWVGEQSGCDAKVQRDAHQCARRSGGSPVVSTVVRQVETSDRFDVLGLPGTHLTSRFRYHDGYYEGIEQEFRGFGATDAVTPGDENSPTSTQRTYLHQGRRAPGIASNRLADNPDESLKGLPYLNETSDEHGVYLSTTHTSYTVQRQVRGLSGVSVAFARPSRTDTYNYDTAAFSPTPAQTVDLPAVTSWDGVTSSHPKVHIRAAGYALTRATADAVDGLGHPLASTAYGRIRGEMGETPDERIVSHASYDNIAGSATGWLWRERTTFLEGAGDPTRLGDTTLTYSAEGDEVSSTTIVTQSFLPRFDGDAEAESFGARSPENVVTSVNPSVWGSPLVQCAGGDAATRAGCLRLSTVAYDEDYASVPLTQSVSTRPLAGGGFATLDTQAIWDRGFATPVEVIEPNLEHTRVFHDGFGRATGMIAPDARGCSGHALSTRIEYLETTDSVSIPVSRVHATTFLSCSDATKRLDVYDFVDGLGSPRARLSPGPDSARPWVKSGVALRDRKGATKAVFDPMFFSGEPTDSTAVLAVPPTAYTKKQYDAFGRDVLDLAQDGSPTRTFYHALSTEVWDALDLGSDATYHATPTMVRNDGHGRPIDQVLRNRQPGSSATEFYRLFSSYRADGVVVHVERAQTTDAQPPGQTVVIGNRLVTRDFFYDSIGRRVGSTDPDSDNRATGDTYRYLFNRAGDLVALRDSRGCGSNYYYDLAGRSVGETYVGCAEAQLQEASVAVLPAGAVGWTRTTTATPVDSLSTYDAYAGSWATNPSGFTDYPAGAGGLKGRLAASIDRGRRSVYAYDARGTAIWEARQMALIMPQGSVPAQLSSIGPPASGDASDGVPVSYDAVHTYVRTSSSDHAGRPTGMVLPADPDFPSGETAPRIMGTQGYDRRGLPVTASVALVSGGGAPTVVDGTIGFTGATIDRRPVVASVEYSADDLPTRRVYGDDLGGARRPTESTTTYDVRRRPSTFQTVRSPTAVDLSGERPLAAVSVVQGQIYHWDAVSNLLAIDDTRPPREWPDGARPQNKTVTVDAAYHVVGVDYAYSQDDGSSTDVDLGTDWRAEQARVKSSDPMRQKPAPIVAALPSGRVASQTWTYDWLGNTTQSTDDAHAFYERSVGNITNGVDVSALERPSALYLAADLSGPPAARGGWTELDYGVSGNVVDMTVHAVCTDAPSKTCSDPGAGGELSSRRASLRSSCTCQREQHYQYRWDELNRLAEARRYDRTGGSGNWLLKVRQRYRYDASNARTVKQTLDLDPGGDPVQRSALYVFPGDFERRGLVRASDRYASDSVLDTETEYLVAGARVVWQAGAAAQGVDADHRISFALGDLLGSANAVIDLRTGALTQHGTYYPNGGRETLRGGPDLVPFEPDGFTGKEDDQEVGLVYFGERYLVPALGRWLSPDPLGVHMMGGGESLNEYHYVSGNLLAARDPLGLSGGAVTPAPPAEPTHPMASAPQSAPVEGAPLAAPAAPVAAAATEATAAEAGTGAAAVGEAGAVAAPVLLGAATVGVVYTGVTRVESLATYGTPYNQSTWGIAFAPIRWQREHQQQQASPAPSPAPGPGPMLPPGPGPQGPQSKQKQMVNMDTGGIIAATQLRDPFMNLSVNAFLADKHIVVTQSVYTEFTTGNIKHAGPQERLLAALFLLRVEVIKDNPSPQVAGLPANSKSQIKYFGPKGSVDRAAFGTGDQMGIWTITGDGKFVDKAAGYNVHLPRVWVVSGQYGSPRYSGQ